LFRVEDGTISSIHSVEHPDEETQVFYLISALYLLSKKERLVDIKRNFLVVYVQGEHFKLSRPLR
jgi:hypothetical protein